MAIGGQGSNIVPVINDILQAVFCCWQGTHLQQGLNVRYYQVQAVGASPANLGQIADEMSNAFAAAYKACLEPLASWYGVIVKRIFPGLPTATATSNALQGVGTGTGDGLPRQTCGLITLKTNLSGRKYRGRAYIPFPSEGMNDPGGTPSAAYQTALTNLAALFIGIRQPGGPAGTTLQPGIYNKETHLLAPIIFAAGRSAWATQRRRGDFGRLNTAPF